MYKKIALKITKYFRMIDRTTEWQVKWQKWKNDRAIDRTFPCNLAFHFGELSRKWCAFKFHTCCSTIISEKITTEKQYILHLIFVLHKTVLILGI